MERWIGQGLIKGDAYENLSELAGDRTRLRALIDKVSDVTDQQIAEIGIYCVRFWEQRPPSSEMTTD